MSDLWVQVLAGIIVAFVSATIGYVVRQGRLQERGVLPGSLPKKDVVDYSHLSGTWHLYYLSRFPHLHNTPLWMHGLEELTVKKNRVEGSTRILDHPSNELSYRVHGEIRQGRMIVTDYSLQDDTEFASIIYPDLLKADLVGVWTGFDGENHLIAAPAIMSRKERSAEELNNVLRTSTMKLIPVDGSYNMLYSQSRITPNSKMEHGDADP